MRMASSGEGRTKKAGGKWKAIPAVLALAAMAVGAGTLRAPAQQATPPAAPTAPAPAGDTAHPGESAPPAKTPTIRTTVELVNVPVTALNKRGQRVIDLNMEDLQVFEDGVEQKITHFERETTHAAPHRFDPRHQQFRAQPIIV